MKAVCSCPWGVPLKHASEELRGEREFVMQAVSKRGYALWHASEELRGDREIVMKAVSDNPHALKFASKELRGDREIVMEAVCNSGSVLRDASKELRGDLEIVMKAASHRDGWVLNYATEELKNSNEFMKVVARSEWGLQVTLLSGRQTNVFFGHDPWFVEQLEQNMDYVLSQVAKNLDMDEQTVRRSVGCCLAPPCRR